MLRRPGPALAFPAALLAAGAALLAPAAPAGARELAGVRMPDSLRAGGRLLRLNGAALYRKLGFKVLVAGLYLPEPQDDPARILASDAPRRYVSHFLRDVGSKRVCDAWWKGLAANTPNADDGVRAKFRTLCGWTRDFRRGDEIVVTYAPGSGSVVEIGGIRKGIIPGKDFADAYFALALGPRPSLGTSFKRRLLGAGAAAPRGSREPARRGP